MRRIVGALLKLVRRRPSGTLAHVVLEWPGMGEAMRGPLHRARRSQGALFTMIKSVGALAILVFVVFTTRAGSIFDDDWTPPPPRKPIVATTIPATQPAATTQAATPVKPATSPATAPAIARRAVPDKAEQARSRRLFK